MKAIIVLVLSVVAAVNAQLLNPVSTMGMGGAWGNPMWHSGMRYPGMMQTSQLNAVTYPTWRSHPLFRMVSTERSAGSNSPSDVINIPKVPSSQEVLTHMVMAATNPKPYLDTISDILYEPQKARTVMSPMAGVSPMSSMSPMTNMGSMAPVATMTSVVPMTGMGVMRASSNMADDCGQENARWERGMDWLY